MKTIEEKIIELMKEGSKEAISMMYDHYSDALYGIVNRIVNDDEQAKDVMQESFVKVWKNIDKYDPTRAKLFTWLLRIFRNSAIDQLRKSERSQEKKLENGVESLRNSRKLEFNPDALDISFHLQGINEKFRNVLEKLYMQGMTQCEVSEAMDLPLGTVKSRARLGLKALRKIYIPVIILLNMSI